MRMISAVLSFVLLVAVACSGSDEKKPTLVIGGIPDQEVSLLNERFGGIADYLEEELGFSVDYQPAVSYATLVTAFENGDVQFSWFGGLTGVQARNATPGATAILQRPIDEQFHSVFVVGADVEASSLADLAGKSFSFGSESSTSGHLMPRYYLTQAGIDADADFQGAPFYSGSHDTTWKLVEAGTYQAGALNAAVWDRAVSEGQVDLTKVRLLETVGPYYDYHWLAHPDIDATYGDGTTDKIRDALLAMSMSDADQANTLELFQTESFIATQDSNYAAIEATARQLGLIE